VYHQDLGREAKTVGLVILEQVQLLQRAGDIFGRNARELRNFIDADWLATVAQNLLKKKYFY
jgi:hypothetical protein